MKKLELICVLAMASTVMTAEPLRVALLDFDNQASVSSDAAVVGGIKPKNVADKGIYVLGKLLANQPDYVLIDRRDFIGHIQAIQLKDGKKSSAVKPSFLRAAQSVNANMVLRGTLQSYSPGKQIINQGGYKTEFLKLSLRVSLEALDVWDGTVIAMVDGVGEKEFRQTDFQKTVVSEDDLVQLLQAALTKAMPMLTRTLKERKEQEDNRQVVKLSVKSSADPALVEIDGMLIGTTPLKNFKTYKGDHIITVGKAGYRDVSKRILLSKDMALEVPLIRTELTADEIKEVLEKSRLNIIAGLPESAILINTLD